MIQERTGVDLGDVRIAIPSDDDFLGLPPGWRRDVAISGIVCTVFSAIAIPQLLSWQKTSLIGSAATVTAAGFGLYESTTAGARWLTGHGSPATVARLRRGLVTTAIATTALAALHAQFFFASAPRS